MSTRGVKFLFSPGEFVLCFEPDSTKARVLYKAKILDTTVYRDPEGKRQPGYHIHFLRWNHSWDRIVSEDFVLRNTEENKALMRQLKDVARKVRKNKTRHKKIGEILTEAFNGKSYPFESGTEDESEDDMTSGTNDTEDESTAEETDSVNSDGRDENRRKQAAPIELEIPDNLKIILDKDYFAINQEKKLVKLPSEINVVTVLESFVKTFMLDFWNPAFDRTHFCHTAPKIAIEKILPMCKEFVDGLRICFDFILPLILLYPNEKDQYQKVSAAFKNKSPAKQKVPTEDSPLIQSPRTRSASKAGNILDEPSPKIPKLSPNIINNDDADDDDEITFMNHEKTTRRLTRRALQSHHDKEEKEEKAEIPEKRELRSSPDRKHMDRKNEKAESSSKIRTRRGSDRDTDNLKRRALRKTRKSSDSSAESDHSKPDTVLSEPAKLGPIKTEKIERPPPLLIPCNLMGTRQNGMEKGPEKGTSGSTDSIGESGKEEILENILSWQMLTPEALEQLPTPPALLYGAHHLLRMFVKLPDLLSQMEMDEHKVGVLTKLLKQFVIYLSEHTIELFPETSYAAASDV